MGSKTSYKFLEDFLKSNSLRKASLSGVLDPFPTPNLLYKMTVCVFAIFSE